MTATAQNARFLLAVGLGTVLLCACAETTDTVDTVTTGDTLAPPLVPPSEGADPAEPPSYEVGIATAAAERNHVKEKCADLPKLERETCEASADATFATAQSGLTDLRGNQQ